MSFRIEEKIPLTNFDFLKVIDYLQINGLEKLYPSRLINSIYFENKNFYSYQDSIEGTLPRRKIRIRYYGNQINKTQLEIKISSIEGRYKTSKNIDNIKYKSLFKNGYFDNGYGLMYPIIQVTYKRSYYMFNKFRLTLDSEINYKKPDLQGIQISSNLRVLEVKTDNMNNKNLIDELLPFAKKRFSKFTEGIESLKLV